MSLDFIDNPLNDWFEGIFFNDIYPKMVLINDHDFNEAFRAADGNLRRNLIRTKTKGMKIHHYYRNILLIRTPDISCGHITII